MRGLLIAVVYCVVSLALADATASLLVGAGFVSADKHNLVLNAIMVVLFVFYLVAPRWLNRSSDFGKQGD